MTAGLRRFAAPARQARAAPEERCELCGEELPDQQYFSPRHRHLVDTESRSLACACQACALLFIRPDGRYRTVPDRVRHDPDAPLARADWSGLSIPVGDRKSLG